MSITVTLHSCLHPRLINIMKAFLMQNFYLWAHTAGIINQDYYTIVSELSFSL